MSEELKKFLEKLKEDEDLQDEVAACETSEEIAKAASGHGFEVTAQEVERAAKEEK